MSEITQNTDYQVQWTPELREAVDNRIIEYLLQGYSQQEAEEKALLDLLDHTTFNYPEVTVSAQAPVLKQAAVESDWDPGYTKFMSGERYYADQDHKNYLDWLRNEYARGIRLATDKWGHAIGAGVEIASGFTPLWWVAPAVRTGLDLSEGDYKGAALNAGLAFAAPYAVGKAFQYGDDLYRGYKTMTNPKEMYAPMSEALSPVKTSSAGVWTNRGTRSARISEAERLGIPKGDRNQALAIKLQIDANTKKIIDFLNSNKRTVDGHNIYKGSHPVNDLRAFLQQNKVDVSKLSSQDLADLVALRQHALQTQSSSRYVVPGESHVRLYAPGKKEAIGYADFGSLSDMYTIDMISNTTFVPGNTPVKGVSEDIMNFLIQKSIKNGGKGVRSGHLLRSPLATTKIWDKYPDKEILSMTEGSHYWEPYKATPGPIVLLKSPSKLVVPSKSFLFSPNSITSDGQMIIEWNKGLYRKNGGKLNYLNYFE